MAIMDQQIKNDQILPKIKILIKRETYTSDFSSLLLVLSEPSFFFLAFFSFRFSRLLLKNPVKHVLGHIEIIVQMQIKYCISNAANILSMPMSK